MDSFLDIYDTSLTKTGEELCGDNIKALKTPDKTYIVVSDGLGSGVKANILSNLTTSIIITMVRSDLPLHEVINTVVGTLPICKVRKVAYATFTIIEIENRTANFRVINFDNPLSFFFHNKRMVELDVEKEKILGQEIAISRGQLARGDFLGAISDGVLYAGLGVEMNFGWGRDNIAPFIESQFRRPGISAQSVVTSVIEETKKLYRGHIGDDASFAGIYVRDRNSLILLTGPPLNELEDSSHVRRFLDFNGRKVVCGGTTANIVASYLHTIVDTDIASMRPDVPPVGTLPHVDLVTEGIFTMAKCLEFLRASNGNPARLPQDPNGAVLLAPWTCST